MDRPRGKRPRQVQVAKGPGKGPVGPFSPNGSGWGGYETAAHDLTRQACERPDRGIPTGALSAAVEAPATWR